MLPASLTEAALTHDAQQLWSNVRNPYGFNSKEVLKRLYVLAINMY